MKLSDFDYELPQELIAQYPADSREKSRMLVLDRATGEISHKNFEDFIDYINPNDILVLNNTKVINARLFGKRATGGKVEIFLLEPVGRGRFKALIKPSRRIKEGEGIDFDNSKLKARLVTKKSAESVIEFSPASIDIEEILDEIGTVPLPPYIRRKAEKLDSNRYQTVYAKVEGATAAPTAGLHFTEEILKNISSKDTKLAYVTLHVSYGTFAPVREENIVNHKMHSESFVLTESAANKINSAKEGDGRVFAVGTTSSRVLETCAVPKVVHSPCSTVHRIVDSRPSSAKASEGRQSAVHRVEAREGKTDLFIYPSYKFKIVDVLLTNFHLPKSTLLMFVSAFAGKELIFKAYKEAIARRYRFFSYGDSMLIK